MSSNHLVLILGMCLVTYLPRLIPFLIVQEIKMPQTLGIFLQYIPYAVLGSLIFPQIFFSAGEENWLPATIATVVCMLLAWFRINIVVVVVTGIFVTYFLS